MRPTTQDIINAYDEYHSSATINAEKRDSSYKKLYEIETEINAALYPVKQKDYNQEAFSKVISSIELNGIASFNMTTFWGKISAAINRNYYNREDTPVNELLMHYEESSYGGDSLDIYTNSFNCDSVGCIAGFAMAEAMNWVQPKWINQDSRNYLTAFENVACSYLNIPVPVGTKLFYGESGCIWSFVRFHEPENYSSLKWEDSEDDLDVYNCDYKDQWVYEGIQLESINYKSAADVLRRIASGEILIDSTNNFTPRYSEETKKKVVENV